MALYCTVPHPPYEVGALPQKYSFFYRMGNAFALGISLCQGGHRMSLEYDFRKALDILAQPRRTCLIRKREKERKEERKKEIRTLALCFDVFIRVHDSFLLRR